jgi:hypothetical protein
MLYPNAEYSGGELFILVNNVPPFLSIPTFPQPLGDSPEFWILTSGSLLYAPCSMRTKKSGPKSDPP